MRRRTKRRQATTIGVGHISQLRFGVNFFKGYPDFSDDVKALEQAWHRLQEKLLADHAGRGKAPGRRPWGFWRFTVGLDVPLGKTPSHSVPELTGMSELEYLREHDLLTATDRAALT